MSLYNYWKGTCSQEGVGPFSQVTKDRMQQVVQVEDQISIRKTFFTECMVKHWKILTSWGNSEIPIPGDI